MISSEANLDLLMADIAQVLREFSDAGLISASKQNCPPFSTTSSKLLWRITALPTPRAIQKDGKFRKIRVDVNANINDEKGKPLKFKVRLRKGYIAKNRNY
jgi:hypothetical protein